MNSPSFNELKSPSSTKELRSLPSEDPVTVSEAVDGLEFGFYHMRTMVLCGFCWAADAMEALLLSFLIPVLKDEWDLAPGIDGMLGAVVFLGILIGNYAWGLIADRYGRRFGYVGCALFTALFGTFSAFSDNIETLLFLRFMVGFGIGGAPVAYSLFAEIVPAAQRSSALLYNQMFWSIGAIIEVALAWLTLETLGWRVFLILSAIPLWVIVACFPFLPESPRFLVSKGRIQEAEEVLNMISQHSSGSDIPRIVLKHSEAPQVVKGSFKILLSPSLRKTTLGLWCIWFADSFIYYGIAFIVPRYFHASDEYLSIFISTLAEFPAIPLGMMIIDRIGRKKTISSCMASCGGLLFLMIFPLSQAAGTLVLFLARLTITTAFLVTYIYTSEVYPTIVRTTGLGAASAASRVAGIATSFVSEDIYTWAAALIFCINAVGTSLVAWNMPIETSGKTMTDEIEMEDLSQASENSRQTFKQLDKVFSTDE